MNYIHRVDGSFTVHNVPTGSYVLEVLSPTYLFEPIRIDVSAKGNIRARRLNNLKPSAVAQVRYPLEMKAVALAKYFQAREKFSIFDMLKNPMVSKKTCFLYFRKLNLFKQMF